MTTTKTRRPRIVAPSGLVGMMTLVRTGSENNLGVRHNAERAYPLARDLVRHLQTDPHAELGPVLASAAAAIFPGIDNPAEEDTALQAGFYVGVATAWLLLMRLTGKDGVR